MGRPLRGSRLASFYTSDTEAEPTAPPSLSTLDSAFQLQEYIGALVRLNPHDIERIVKVPGVNSAANGGEKEKDAVGEDERVSVDEACWIYEQLRRLAQDLTHPLITMLQQECTRKTCPEMKAGEWLYLCVAHGNSGAMEHCCAIDYIVHTLDSATALLNSPRAFPSRISIPQTSHRHFPSLARRLGRIFAHAYHHHRLAFESAEAESALYARFLSLSRHFDLVPAEFLVIPERNAQAEEEDVGRGQRDVGLKEITLLTRHHEDAASLPGPTTSSSSHSPRIGGRARTDTMYLSGGYVSPHKDDSPDVSPGRLPDTMDTALATDVSQAQATASTSAQGVTEETMAQEGTGDDVLAQPATDSVAEQAPDTTAPVRISGQILARDFALEPPPPVVAPEPTEGAADNAPDDDVGSQAVSEDTADTDKEQDEQPSASLDAPTDASETTSPDANDSAMAPVESADPTPTPLPAEYAVAEPLVPVLIGFDEAELVETRVELLQSFADESAVAPDPDVPEVVSPDLSKDDDDDDAGAGGTREDEVGESEDEVKGEPADEVKGEPADEVKGEPEDEVKGEPEDEVKGEPEDDVKGEPEDDVKGDETVAKVETSTEADEASIDHAEISAPADEVAQVSSGGT